jgi:hypothetical protein
MNTVGVMPNSFKIHRTGNTSDTAMPTLAFHVHLVYPNLKDWRYSASDPKMVRHSTLL